MTEKLYFEDIAEGDRFEGATVTVDRARMLEFANEFDDQPMHLDEAAAREMGFRDIVCNGSYIFCLSSKSSTKIWQEWHFLPSGVGIEVSFLAPVFAGDVLSGEMVVTGTRLSRKPGRGWLANELTLTNQDGEVVLLTKSNSLVRCREK
ncbi:MAG: MaoC/PaaZ C-terminal domain-containing protein [Proteobacteria bacterium]|nr:MaoC/PaaZ C-terminal domain-containing protein [Pseudomonadota bacterium]